MVIDIVNDSSLVWCLLLQWDAWSCHYQLALGHPQFDDLVSRDAGHAQTREARPFAARWHTEQLPLLRAAQAPPCGHPIPVGHETADLDPEMGKTEPNWAPARRTPSGPEKRPVGKSMMASGAIRSFAARSLPPARTSMKNRRTNLVLRWALGVLCPDIGAVAVAWFIWLLSPRCPSRSGLASIRDDAAGVGRARSGHTSITGTALCAAAAAVGLPAVEGRPPWDLNTAVSAMRKTGWGGGHGKLCGTARPKSTATTASQAGPASVVTATRSPARWARSASPTGDSCEIRPASRSASAGSTMV